MSSRSYLLKIIFGAILCGLLSPFSTSAQKIKFNLDLQDQRYVGTMNPKWFDQVYLYSTSTDPLKLVGDSGLMSGEKFGEMSFSLENNTTGNSEELMIKTRNGWYPIEKLKMQDGNLRLMFDWGFKAPPQSMDLEVLQRADDLLQSEVHWNQQDDRQCEDDIEARKWSLYCVLKQASLDLTNDFNHRSYALNQFRKEIASLNPKRKYEHQLMDFNNEEEFRSIKKVLSLAVEHAQTELSDGQ